MKQLMFLLTVWTAVTLCRSDNENKIRVERAAEDTNADSTYSRPLLISTILTKPFMMLQDPNDRTKGFYGYIVDLLDVIAQDVGFSYKLQLVKDGNYGYPDEHGRWNGMVGEVVRKEVDLAAAPLTVTAVRERYISYTKPFMTVGLTFLVKKPERQEHSYIRHYGWLFSPFSLPVWILGLVAWILVWIVLVIINRFSPYEWQQKYKRGIAVKPDSKHYSPPNSAFSITSMLFWQGYDRAPASVSARVLLIGWWAFVACFAIAFTAALTASIIWEDKSVVLHDMYVTPEGLVKTNRSYGTLCGGSSQSFFRNSKQAVFQRMNMKMEAQKSCSESTEVGIKRVQEGMGQFVFIGESTLLHYASSRRPCDTVTIDPRISSRYYAFILPKAHERVQRDIDLAILKFHENGVLGKLYHKWWTDMSECHGATMIESPQIDSTAKNEMPLALPIRLQRFGFAIGLMGLFIFLSLASLVCEVIYYRVKGGRDESQSKQKDDV